MKERPILFSSPMVRAILEGRKTQTRRVVKHPHADISGMKAACQAQDGSWIFWDHWSADICLFTEVAYKSGGIFCPYGKPGDRFYVKEKHKYYDWTEDGEPFIQYAADDAVRLCRVDGDEWGEKTFDIWAKLSMPKNYLINRRACDQNWRPSIHMPRWASRIILENAAVRVERLQDISRGDAKAEGFLPGLNGLESWNGQSYGNSQLAFEACWKDINGPGSWEQNPWVWVVEFRRMPQ